MFSSATIFVKDTSSLTKTAVSSLIFLFYSWPHSLESLHDSHSYPFTTTIQQHYPSILNPPVVSLLMQIIIKRTVLSMTCKASLWPGLQPCSSLSPLYQLSLVSCGTFNAPSMLPPQSPLAYQPLILYAEPKNAGFLPHSFRFLLKSDISGESFWVWLLYIK